MARVFLIFLFSLSVIGCSRKQAQGIQEPQAIQQAQPAASAYEWDFGEVKQGEVLKHNFVFKNESSRGLTIKNINTSCGCTASEAAKKVLGPLESTIIEVKLDSRGYSGPVKQFVYVNTDNLDNPVVRYIIEAQVIK